MNKPGYAVAVPYRPRRRHVEVDHNGLAVVVYPLRGTAPYNEEEVIDILIIFNARWLRTGRWPSSEFEPVAKLIKGEFSTLPKIFTLQEVRPELIRIFSESDEENDDEI